MSISSDPIPYADFVISSLLKPLPAGAGAKRAIAETEHPIEGDDWFWADDNAKVLELLAIPAIWRANPDVVADTLHFIERLCDGPFIFRRMAVPRLLTRRNEAGQGDFLHSFMNIQCDLAAGTVHLGMRFHDGRTARNVTFTGNYVRFGCRGTVYTADAEEGIFDHAIEQTSTGIKLVWRSNIMFGKARFPWQHRQKLGVLTYTCSIEAHSMFVGLEAALDIEPGLEVSDVVLTFGHDNLSHNDNGIRYETVGAVQGDAATLLSRPQSGQAALAVRGANYWYVAQNSHMAGFAAAVHTLPRDPAQLHTLRGAYNEQDQLHWLVSEYEFPGPQHGRISAAERKIITSGGFYHLPQLYAETLPRWAQRADAGEPPVDLSISYDYGAELNAFARCYQVLSGDNPPVQDPDLLRQVAGLVERWQDVYRTQFMGPARAGSAKVFSRSLAFAALAYASLLETNSATTGAAGHAEALREACDMILGFERENTAVDGSPQSGFLMGKEEDAMPYVDCHSACLLALARGTALLDEAAWLGSIDRGLAAYRLDTISIFFLGTQKQDIVGVDYLSPNGTRRTLDMFWNFNAGLTLRLFNALRATTHPGLQAVWAKHDGRLSMLEVMMRERIRRSLRPRGAGTEILTSMLSAEGNSETQPWVALGLIGTAVAAE
jgi:hypothetical protein